MTLTTITKTVADHDGVESEVATSELDIWEFYLVTQQVLLKELHTKVHPVDKKEVALALEAVSKGAQAFKTTMGTTI